MPDTRKIVRVFLASPGDLSEERKAAKRAIDEVNATWAEHFSFHIDLIGWEETISGYGRPQALINQDLDRCEVFLGLMWKRWGSSPGGKYTSGFEEEFNIALNKRKSVGQPEITLFFKEIEPDVLEDPGLDLKKVLAFKEHIVSSKTVLFEPFSNVGQFEARLRRWFGKYLQVLQAQERKATNDNQAQHSDEALTTEGSPKAHGGTLWLPREGAQFLKEIATRNSADVDSVSAVEVARFRLLAKLARKVGNDDGPLGAHDSNLLYSQRSAISLSQREIWGLVESGFAHFRNENAPIWYWLVEANLIERELIPIFTSGSPSQTTGALDVLRLLGARLSRSGEARSVFIAEWLATKNATVQKAALRYLTDCGLMDDLPLIKQAANGADSQVTAAAHQAMLGITVRHSRDQALELLNELQPDSVDEEVLSAIFRHSQSLSPVELAKALTHKNFKLRKLAATSLRSQNALTPSLAEGLITDSDAELRLIAVEALVENGSKLSDDQVKGILVKPQNKPFGLIALTSSYPSDTEGERCWEQFRKRRLKTLPLIEVQKIAGAEWIYDRTATFCLWEREFLKHQDEIRAAVDNQFSQEFDEALTKMKKALGADLTEPSVSLQAYLKKTYTREALNIICDRATAQDLNRVRAALGNQQLEYSSADIDYLKRFGEWADIPLLISLADRSSGGTILALLSFGSDHFREIAKAVYHIGRDRFEELLSFPMPARLLKQVILQSADSVFRTLSDGAIGDLLQSQNEENRKTATVKCVRSIPKTRIAALLHAHMSQGQYFYNVAHWLDLGVSLPRPLAITVADKVLSQLSQS